MSSIAKQNYHKYKNDQQLQEWYEKAQTQLKKKMFDCLQKRITNAAQAVNYAIKKLIKNTASNCIWAVLFCNQSINNYQQMFPVFIISETLIKSAENEFSQKVDQWAGVDVNSMSERPKKYAKYWKTADNWWNRYKAEWTGDFFFYPLLHDQLFKYIENVTRNYPLLNEHSSYQKNATEELLYFTALKKVLYTEVSFTRARAFPLILDQSFVKSQCLHQFFSCIGNEHGSKWVIPPKLSGGKNSLHIRRYARTWAERILKAKQSNYNTVVMRHNTVSAQRISSSALAQICDNLPPIIEFNLPSIPTPNHTNMKTTVNYAANGDNNEYLDAIGIITNAPLHSHTPQQPNKARFFYNSQTKQYIRTQPSDISQFDDDSHSYNSRQSGSTVSSATVYAPKPYRPYRRRGVSHAVHNRYPMHNVHHRYYQNRRVNAMNAMNASEMNVLIDTPSPQTHLVSDGSGSHSSISFEESLSYNSHSHGQSISNSDSKIDFMGNEFVFTENECNFNNILNSDFL